MSASTACTSSPAAPAGVDLSMVTVNGTTGGLPDEVDGTEIGVSGLIAGGRAAGRELQHHLLGGAGRLVKSMLPLMEPPARTLVAPEKCGVARNALALPTVTVAGICVANRP